MFRKITYLISVLSIFIMVSCQNPVTEAPKSSTTDTNTVTKTGLVVERQESRSLTGVLSNYWVNIYDASGFMVETKYYDANDVQQSTLKYLYTQGRTL